MKSYVQSPGPTDGSVVVRLVFKEEGHALTAVRKFNGETADGRTLIVKSVGGQAVNLAARLDSGSLKDGSVDALITPSSTSCVTSVSHDSIILIWVVANFARMISWLKIRGPRCCSPPPVQTLGNMFNNSLGAVEMAEAVVVVVQNAAGRAGRVVASPQGWMLIDLFPFSYLPSFVLLTSPHSVSHYAYRTACNFPRSLSHKSSMKICEALVISTDERCLRGLR